MATAWSENQAFVGLRTTKHLWEALARKNSREMVQKLIEEAGVDPGRDSRGILLKALVCVVSEWDHETAWDQYMRLHFSCAFHTFVFRSRCQSPTKHVDPITRGGSGSHAVWSLADGPPGSDEKWRNQGRISSIFTVRFADGKGSITMYYVAKVNSAGRVGVNSASCCLVRFSLIISIISHFQRSDFVMTCFQK